MPPFPRKVLFIRFSSIGDVLLTTPVVRRLKEASPETEIHFLVRPAFRELLSDNPFISRLHVYAGSISGTADLLKGEKFDYIFDLQRNLRSYLLSWRLSGKRITFPKLNLRKYIYVNTGINLLPQAHIVDRYAAVLSPWGLHPDDKGMDMYLSKEADSLGASLMKDHFREQPYAVVLGATWFTKKWPTEYFPVLINRIGRPVVILGGQAEREDADRITGSLTVPYLDAAGKYSLQESGALLRRCRFVVTHDTGLMHMAAAFGLKVYSIWGNTVPEFGMYPYKTESVIIQHESLRCRPCSKIGYDACPKGHFRCMRDLDPEWVFRKIAGEPQTFR